MISYLLLWAFACTTGAPPEPESNEGTAAALIDTSVPEAAATRAED